MKILILFVIPVFLVACSGEPSNNSFENKKKKSSPKLTFVEWANGLPAHLNGDTLFSNSFQNNIKECDVTYLPENSQMIGRWISFGSEDEFCFYLLIVYLEDGKKIPYLEVFDSKGNREFSKRLFNNDFLKQDSTHFGRVYRYKLDKYITFESCKRVDGQILVEKSEKYDILKMMRKYST